MVYNVPISTEVSFCMKTNPIFGKQVSYRMWNEFSFHALFMKRFVCFYINEPSARGYKTHNEFHIIIISTVWNENLFQILLITCFTRKTAKNTILSSFIIYFTAENAPTSGSHLRRHRRIVAAQPIKMLASAVINKHKQRSMWWT